MGPVGIAARFVIAGCSTVIKSSEDTPQIGTQTGVFAIDEAQCAINSRFAQIGVDEERPYHPAAQA